MLAEIYQGVFVSDGNIFIFILLEMKEIKLI